MCLPLMEKPLIGVLGADAKTSLSYGPRAEILLGGAEIFVAPFARDYTPYENISAPLPLKMESAPDKKNPIF